MWKKLGFVSLFLLVVAFGFFIRTSRLGDIPAGFFCDEADIGVNASLLLTTGHDEYGVAFPVFLRSFGQYIGPVQVYSDIPFVWAFGLSEYATRLPSAVYGTLSLLVIFLLVRQVFRKQTYGTSVAFLSSLLLAITPWHIQFSRTSLDALTGFVFFTMLGYYLFLKAQDKPLFLPVSLLAFVIALYSYFVARIFIPLFGLVLFITYFRYFLKHIWLTSICSVFLTLLLIPFVMISLSSDGMTHWKQVSIFYNPPKNETVIEHMASNYFRHFSVDFLFLKGDIGMPGQFITRHSVRHFGEFYFFELPLVLAGLYFLFSRHRQVGESKFFVMLLVWLLLFPLGSSMSADESPQATRSFIGVVPFTILAALGLWYLSDLWKRKIKHVYFLYPTFWVIVICASFLSYYAAYILVYPTYSSDFWGWQFGQRDVIRYFVRHETSYDDLYLISAANSPKIFIKFYAPNDCLKCKIGVPDQVYDPNRRQLFAVTMQYMKDNAGFRYTPLDIVRYPDGKVAFVLVQVALKNRIHQ